MKVPHDHACLSHYPYPYQVPTCAHEVVVPEASDHGDHQDAVGGLQTVRQDLHDEAYQGDDVAPAALWVVMLSDGRLLGLLLTPLPSVGGGGGGQGNGL